MALPHAHSGQPIRLRPLGSELRTTPTHALRKGQQLELIRMQLAAGKSAPQHHLRGESTLQCLEGQVQVDLADGPITLGPGDLVWLEAGVQHGAVALTDASVLLTVAL